MKRLIITIMFLFVCLFYTHGQNRFDYNNADYVLRVEHIDYWLDVYGIPPESLPEGLASYNLLEDFQYAWLVNTANVPITLILDDTVTILETRFHRYRHLPQYSDRITTLDVFFINANSIESPNRGAAIFWASYIFLQDRENINILPNNRILLVIDKRRPPAIIGGKILVNGVEKTFMARL